MTHLEEHSHIEMIRGALQLSIIKASNERTRFDLENISLTKLAAEIKVLYYLHPISLCGEKMFSKVIDFSTLKFKDESDMAENIEFWLAFSELEPIRKINDIKILPTLIWHVSGIALPERENNKFHLKFLDEKFSN